VWLARSPTRTNTADVEAIVNDITARYDVILGYDVMVSARMAKCFETKTIRNPMGRPFDGMEGRFPRALGIFFASHTSRYRL
jgi:hypothetical protein